LGAKHLKCFVTSGALALTAVLSLGASAAQAGIDITVTPWLAPNAFGSPSFAPAAANAVDALYNGQTSGGAAGTPSFFQAQSNVQASETIVTDFASWKGQLNPGVTVGAAFANEYGERMTFGLSIVGTGGTMFSISQLSFNAVSNDANNILGFSFGTGQYDYSDGNYVGVLYGADGQLGGGDDTFVTGGANTQLVNAIFARGSGNSLENDPTDPVATPAEQQASLQAATYFAGQPSEFTGTYRIGDFSGSGTFDIAVPEPASWALMILGFGGVGAALRRRQRAMEPA
jgi:hypothetical protein